MLKISVFNKTGTENKIILPSLETYPVCEGFIHSWKCPLKCWQLTVYHNVSYYLSTQVCIQNFHAQKAVVQYHNAYVHSYPCKNELVGTW